LIADGMPHTVIDIFKMVNVDKKERKIVVRMPLGIFNSMLQAVS
jgi:hypothetical protein